MLALYDEYHFTQPPASDLNNLGYPVCMYMYMQIFEYFLQFKRMLNRELNHFSESGKSGSQVSDYIFSTFMGEEGAHF